MLAFMPGGWEWFIILIVALLIFGPRLPSVMRSLGRSVTEFKEGMNEVTDEPDAGNGPTEGPEQKAAEPDDHESGEPIG